MKIVALTLTDFKRMALRQISYFEFTPKSLLQLIVGSNGSGKSSLLRELSPLPAEVKAFKKSGSKIVEVEHKGSRYRLSSWFDPNPKHSFRKDDVELNEGGTLTVQKELVERELGYNQALHNLLIGLERFTEMAPKRRREWITKLSPVNYDFALREYRKWQERLRDSAGAVKRFKQQLVDLQAAAVSIEQQQTLEKEVLQMHNELTFLLNLRKPLDFDLQAVTRERSDCLEEIDRLASSLLKLRVSSPFALYGYSDVERDDWGVLIERGFKSIEQVEEYLTMLRGKTSGIEFVIEQQTRQFRKLDETRAILQKTGEKSIGSLQNEITELRASITVLLSNQRLRLGSDSPQSGMDILSGMQESLFEVFSQIDENPDKRYSREKRDEYTKERMVLRERLAEINAQGAKLDGMKAHFDAHKEKNRMTCPVCRHMWIPKEDEQSLEDIEKKTKALLTEHEEKAARLKKLDDILGEYEVYASYYRRYMECVKSAPILSPLWEYIASTNYLLNAPKKLMNVTTMYLADLQDLRSASVLQEQVREKARVIDAAKEVGDANLQNTQEAIAALEQELSQNTLKLTRLREEHKRYDQYRQQLMSAEQLAQRLRDAKTMHEALLSREIETLRRDTFNHAIRQYQSTLARKEESLSDISNRRRRVSELEELIARTEKEAFVQKEILNVLSPTEGLIAHGLLGFVQSMIEEMNSVIESIWTYPLTLLECQSMVGEDAELDYTFPLIVAEQTDDPVPDVGEASEGQKEIVNLAFKLIVMKYLGVDLLYLDEFGSKMDTAHKQAAAALISTILQDYGFSQVYMVSHDAFIHGALPHADVCVLDPTNIAVPEIYNQHVSMQ